MAATNMFNSDYCSGEQDGGRPDALDQVRHLRGAGDRNYKRLLGQEPGKGDLTETSLLAFRPDLH